MEICYSMFNAPFTTMLSFSTLLVFITIALCYLFKLQWQRHLTTIFSPLGDQWRKIKRVMVREIHRWLHEKRFEEADDLVRYILNQWKNGDEGGLVDLRLVAQHNCCNVSRKLIFNRRYLGEGKADGGPGFEEEEYVDVIFACVIHIYSFCISDYLPFLRYLNLVLEKYKNPIIDGRIQQWRVGNKHEPQDLLDVLVSLTDDDDAPLLSANEIKAEVNVHLSYSFAEMLNNPKMLKKAKEELDNVVGKDRLVQESDFPQLNRIKACAREAFRLHPIVPFSPPHVISKLTFKFKLEHHLQDCNKGKVVLAGPDLRLFTFSRGRRGCPGVLLGSLMTIMMFARLLQGFNRNIPTNLETIDLCQGRGVPFLAKPLLAVAKLKLKYSD
ncbi:hypothetical protein GOBAR_AA40131 [Gossypium barbadense]|uniref:Cytochrome P450 n=1 Tax=Gossypium barbadense TaxID=3634 RepID=A0A2P5VP17_GOSBA|nr:hypothetical protein GOBAR_AA40131 [Gossypium barbadense]